jgi:hypothetical protein
VLIREAAGGENCVDAELGEYAISGNNLVSLTLELDAELP